MTETTKFRSTKRERELQVKLDTANQIVDAHVATIAALIAQLERAVAGQDARREVPELVIAQIVTNRDVAAPKVVELRVGDTVLRNAAGVVVVPAKSTTVVEGKVVSNSYATMNMRFDRAGQAHMPAHAAASFVERARAMGWVPAE